MQNHLQKGIYAITPDEMDSTKLVREVEGVLGAGVSCLQYRNKKADASLQLEQAGLLRALCSLHDVPLIINDNVQLALAVDADGVHLGADDGSIAQARELLGTDRIIGASCYADLSLAKRAVEEGANYVAFGAVFTSPTKPNAPSVALDVFGQATQFGVPVVAIGGITADNGHQVIAAGADLLAVISGIFGASDLSAAVRAYQECFKET